MALRVPACRLRASTSRAARTDAEGMTVLGLLATHYSSAGLDQEYNSSKHGLRAMPAPWSLMISPTDQPDLRVAIGATPGSHFLVDDRGTGSAKHYFTLRRRSQSWHPERDLKLSQLCSWLLHNLISARRSPGPRRQFYAFCNIYLDDLRRLVQQVVHFEMGTPLDLPEPVPSRGESAPGAQAIAANVATWSGGSIRPSPRSASRGVRPALGTAGSAPSPPGPLRAPARPGREFERRRMACRAPADEPPLLRVHHPSRPVRVVGGSAEQPARLARLTAVGGRRGRVRQ